MKSIVPKPVIDKLSRWLLLISVTLTLLLCIGIYARFVVWPVPPELAIRIAEVESGIAGPVCPGQRVRIVSRLTVLHPMILELAFSVMDGEAIRNVGGTQIEYLPRPQPNVGAFDQITIWIVPELEPGDYARVMSFQSHNSESQPVFLIVPFVIKGGCEK